MQTIVEWLSGRSRWISGGVALVLVFAVGFVDDLVNRYVAHDAVTSLLYLFPIALGTWTGGRVVGLVTAAVAVCDEWGGEMLAPGTFSRSWVPYLNAGVRLGIFLAFSAVLSSLKRALDRERLLARVDSLTGAANSRSFYEMAQIEIDRAERWKRPLSVAYLDLDFFKKVNDQYGHAAGDALLKAVAKAARDHLRSTDLIARLGGDEFAILLPETGVEAVQAAVGKLREALEEATRRHGWPATMSMGVVTYLTPPGTVDQVIRQADELMYQAKHAGKDAVRFLVIGEEAVHGA